MREFFAVIGVVVCTVGAMSVLAVFWILISALWRAKRKPSEPTDEQLMGWDEEEQKERLRRLAQRGAKLSGTPRVKFIGARSKMRKRRADGATPSTEAMSRGFAEVGDEEDEDEGRGSMVIDPDAIARKEARANPGTPRTDGSSPENTETPEGG